MEPYNSNDENKPARASEYVDSESDEAAAPGAAAGVGAGRTEPQPTAVQKLANNWIAIAGILVVVLFAGLFLWVRSAKQEAMKEDEPVAAASANIEEQIPAAATAPAAIAVTPLEQIEAQRAEKERAKYVQPTQSSAEAADVFAVDTSGLARRRKQRALVASARRAEAARQAADVDTIETTAQDPVTGAYRANSVIVPRNRTASYGGGGRGNRGAASMLPARDVDGVPFETDPDVLAMLSTSPAETRLQYEKMTGRRYRDPAVAAQMIAQRGNANAGNGAGSAMMYDGFNTVKVGNASRMMSQDQQQQLTPDVFYQCVINGPQKVRTGSVVIMRLVEDAVISGVTFPKNMIFAAVANVGTNNVTLRINRLAATRVGAEIYDFNYMPGIMIDPNKKIPRVDDSGNQLRNSATTEVTTAIDRSASAANSVTGVAGRLLTTMIGRNPTTTKLRDVMLPDGYPILITSSAAGQLGGQASGNQALGAQAPGLMGR